MTASYDTGAWLRVSLPLWLDGGLRLLSASLDILLVGAMLGMAEAGVYAIVKRLAELIAFGTNASQAAVRPYIATLHAEGDREAMQRVVTTASSWGTLFAIVTCGALIPARALLLRQFGDEYLPGASALIALSLGYLVNACTAIAHAVMNMTDHQRANMRITAICLALKLPLSVVAISHWGFTGGGRSLRRDAGVQLSLELELCAPCPRHRRHGLQLVQSAEVVPGGVNLLITATRP